MNDKEFRKGEIVIYKSPEGHGIQVRLEEERVWLDAHLIERLFNVNSLAIVKHVNNIYKTGELDKKSTCSTKDLQETIALPQEKSQYELRAGQEQEIIGGAIEFSKIRLEIWSICVVRLIKHLIQCSGIKKPESIISILEVSNI